MNIRGTLILIFLCTVSFSLSAQIKIFPYRESFDSIIVPNLPAGWTASSAKSPTGDFAATTSTVHSTPNALVSKDAKIAQELVSPVFDFTGKIVGELSFYEQRSSSHNSGFLVEAAIGSDTTFAIPLADTLMNPGTTNYVLRQIPLSHLLSNRSHVQFRWRVVGNGTGAAGSLRIDDISITVQKIIDLAVTSFTVRPSPPESGSELSISATVQNLARAGTLSYSLQVLDSSLHGTRLLSENSFSYSFSAMESVTVQLLLPRLKPGAHLLTAKLDVVNDEDTSNNFLSQSMFIPYSPRSILVNEIMYAPPSGMPEWIECVNNSDDTISLAQWKIGDNSSTRAVIASQFIGIEPHQLFIITKDSSLLTLFPIMQTLVLKAPFPSLNNDVDAVVLVDPSGCTIDSIAYLSSWGGTNGKSLERIDTALASNDVVNWKSSRSPLGATPGFVNSVSKKNFDVSVERISFSPPFPTAGDQTTIETTIKNIGRQSLQNVVVKLFLDTNKDSVLTASEMFFQQNIGTLAANDPAIVEAATPPLQHGAHWIFVSASAQQDDDTTNNLQCAVITAGIQPRSIVINEIMYAPTGDEPEWFECYNTSSAQISLAGWKVSDSGPAKAALQNGSTTIPPHSFFIVTHDTSFKNYYTISVPVFYSSFSALNNTTADAVILYDDRGAVMDSVFYHPSWGGMSGNSLQRFDFFGSSNDSLNWLSSVPSPGINNPVAKKEFDAAIQRFTSIKAETGAHFSFTLTNAGRQTIAGAVLKLYHDINADSVAQSDELLYTATVPSLDPSDSVELPWDWNAQFSGKQNFIAVIEYAQDERSENDTAFTSIQNSFAAGELVINEIMYDPTSGNAEFVELYNRSSDSIDVYNWKLMNQPTSSEKRGTVVLSKVRSFLPPNEFTVVANDSSIFTQFPFLTGKNVVVNSSLSLSNSGEDVVLVDLTDAQIDSVHYSPSWHLKNISTKGRSLERINPNAGANDTRNWSSSVSPGAATPGAKNSIYTPSLPPTSSLSLSPNPFSPDNDGFEDFLSINYALPTNSAMVRLRIYDVTGRLVRLLANDEPASSSGTIIWNGLDDKGERVRIGMYIILFEALDNFGGTVRTMKDVAVVAAKL